MFWSWWYLAGFVLVGTALSALFLYVMLRWLGKREPYRHVLKLPIRRKLTFLRLVLRDNRIPLHVKVLPLIAIAYAISPLDLIPGIAIDDIALALLALVLVIRLTPRLLIMELVQQAQGAGAACDSNQPADGG